MKTYNVGIAYHGGSWETVEAASEDEARQKALEQASRSVDERLKASDAELIDDLSVYELELVELRRWDVMVGYSCHEMVRVSAYTEEDARAKAKAAAEGVDVTPEMDAPSTFGVELAQEHDEEDEAQPSEGGTRE